MNFEFFFYDLKTQIKETQYELNTLLYSKLLFNGKYEQIKYQNYQKTTVNVLQKGFTINLSCLIEKFYNLIILLNFKVCRAFSWSYNQRTRNNVSQGKIINIIRQMLWGVFKLYCPARTLASNTSYKVCQQVH